MIWTDVELATVEHERWFKAWLDDPSAVNKAHWQWSVRQLKLARKAAAPGEHREIQRQTANLRAAYVRRRSSGLSN